MSTPIPYLHARQLPPPSSWQLSRHNSAQTHYSRPLDVPRRIVFRRQLWKRNMPDENQRERGVLNQSQHEVLHSNQASTSRTGKGSLSTIQLRPRNRSRSPSPSSPAPLTPDESPPNSTRKRGAGIVEQEDKAFTDTEVSPAHSRADSGEQAVHVCICQPDPKIPRPRNGMLW